MDTGLLLLRIVVGGTIALHGSQKVFGAFGGPGMAGTHGIVESMGLRPARPLALLLATSELVGGTLLALGFLTPLAAMAAAGVMVSASRLVHWDNGFFAQAGGFEFPLTLGVAAVAIAFTGPGRWSLDHAFGWNLAGNGWGVAVAAIALGSSVLVAAMARRLVFQRRGDAVPV
jgi:putative oxidoreductase